MNAPSPPPASLGALPDEVATNVRTHRKFGDSTSPLHLPAVPSFPRRRRRRRQSRRVCTAPSHATTAEDSSFSSSSTPSSFFGFWASVFFVGWWRWWCVMMKRREECGACACAEFVCGQRLARRCYAAFFDWFDTCEQGAVCVAAVAR